MLNDNSTLPIYKPDYDYPKSLFFYSVEEWNKETIVRNFSLNSYTSLCRNNMQQYKAALIEQLNQQDNTTVFIK